MWARDITDLIWVKSRSKTPHEFHRFSGWMYRQRFPPAYLNALVWRLTELAIGAGPTVFTTCAREIAINPARIATNWRRAMAIDINGGHFAAIWGAWNRSSDTVYLYDEYSLAGVPLPAHAAAIKQRGPWIPGLFDAEGHGRLKPRGFAHANRLLELQVNIRAVPFDLGRGLDRFEYRLTTGRLKVFSTCTNWIKEYGRSRWVERENIAAGDDNLMLATALLCQYVEEVSISENQWSAMEATEQESGRSESGRNTITGY